MIETVTNLETNTLLFVLLSYHANRIALRIIVGTKWIRFPSIDRAIVLIRYVSIISGSLRSPFTANRPCW